MRTKLADLKRNLFNGIFDSSYKNFLSNEQTNQRSFIMAFFPLSFLRQEENAFIIEVRSNNSSRLSNIFNRATDPKKNELRFRERFIAAFDVDFYNEMIDSSKFFLRNYNKEKFEELVEMILTQDEELNEKENNYLHSYITKFYQTHPENIIALLILWAFHIDSFDAIIDIVKQHENRLIINTSERVQQTTNQKEWDELLSFQKSLNIKPGHIQDYLKIATTYGISGQISAVVLRTYIDMNRGINPLIYTEVADMLYYGNNYSKRDVNKAMNLFKSAADTGYAPAIWSLGQLNNHALHSLTSKNVYASRNYYIQAFELSSPLSMINLGILYHRAYNLYLSQKQSYSFNSDCFSVEIPNGSLSLYYCMKEDPYFIHLLSTYDITAYNNSLEGADLEYKQLMILEDMEKDILNKFFFPSYKEHNYYNAIGSTLTIYESQYKRLETYWHKQGLEFSQQPDYDKYKFHIISSVEKFIQHFCTESYYRYASLLERFNTLELQTAYDHYYIAAFETPHRAFKLPALIRFLELHYDPKILRKKQDFIAHELLINHMLELSMNYDADEHLLLRAMDILTLRLKIKLHSYLSDEDCLQLQNKLINEMLHTAIRKQDYEKYINHLELILSN